MVPGHLHRPSSWRAAATAPENGLRDGVTHKRFRQQTKVPPKPIKVGFPFPVRVLMGEPPARHSSRPSRFSSACLVQSPIWFVAARRHLVVFISKAHRAKDNGPAIYRWVSGRQGNESRQGRKNTPALPHNFFRPCGAWTGSFAIVPAINRWAIVGRPYGTWLTSRRSRFRSSSACFREFFRWH